MSRLITDWHFATVFSLCLWYLLFTGLMLYGAMVNSRLAFGLGLIGIVLEILWVGYLVWLVHALERT